jgi:outer membrane protein TolC
MKTPTILLSSSFFCLLATSCSFAGPPYEDSSSSEETVPIPVSGTALDLATTLRLAGARNLEVQFARQRLIEAEGDYASERLKYFPTLAPGIGYRRHDGRIQDTGGTLLDVSKQSYAPGVAIVAELNLGEAIYQNLVAKQLTEARAGGVERQRSEAMLEAGLAYYDLAFANALEFSAREDVRLSEEQESQLSAAVEAGIALKGDVLRVTVQKQRNKLIVRQAGELADIASTRLASALHLDPTVSLHTTARSLSPLSMVEVTEGNAAALVARAQAAYPSLAEAAALTVAAEKSRDAVIYGPRVPTLTAKAFLGGLGGGRGGATGNFGDQQDLIIGLSWRFGAGGLFDEGRRKSAEARLEQSRLSEEQVKEKLAELVSAAHASARSARDRLATARSLLSTAEQVVTLSKERKEFGVGVVLEMIQSSTELARSRQDYLSAIADENKAQFALAIYTGRLGRSSGKN